MKKIHITLEDLRMVANMLGENMTDDELREMIFEANKKDRNGTVDIDQFLSILTKKDWVLSYKLKLLLYILWMVWSRCLSPIISSTKEDLTLIPWSRQTQSNYPTASSQENEYPTSLKRNIPTTQTLKMKRVDKLRLPQFQKRMSSRIFRCTPLHQTSQWTWKTYSKTKKLNMKMTQAKYSKCRGALATATQ